jgi:ATP-dependent Lon protease
MLGTSATKIRSYAVLPLRDIVVFPHMIVPLFVGREKSVVALENVIHADKKILLVTQKNPSEDDPQSNQMEKTQREYYLNEQMKAIQKELGDGEDGQNEVAELEERIAKTQLRRKPAKRPRPS